MNLEELAKWAEWFRDRCGTKEDEARLTAAAAACRELAEHRENGYTPRERTGYVPGREQSGSTIFEGTVSNKAIEATDAALAECGGRVG